MTNVALFAPKFPPESGGASVYFKQVTELLSDTEYEPVVFTSTHPERNPRELHAGYTVLSQYPQLGDRIYRGIEYLPTLYSHLQDFEIDIAHVHPHFPQYRWFKWVLAYLDIPRVYDCRDQDFTRWYVRDGSHYLVATQQIGSLLQSECGVRPWNITRSPVVMPPIEHSPTGFEGTNVAFVGDLATHKGVDIAIGAVEDLENVTLQVAGSGPLENRVRESESCVYHGCLDHAKALGLIHASDVLVLPSKSEGRPRVILEALTLGTPVVATDAGETASMIGNAGLIVDRDSDSVRDGLGQVISRPVYAEWAKEMCVGGNQSDVKKALVRAYQSI